MSVNAPAGFFAQSGGYEFAALLGCSAAALGISGPGRYSLDHLTCHVLDRPWLIPTAFTTSALAAAAVIKRRMAVTAERELAEEEELE
ncbi:hypothetical protein SVIO_014430 [Streptomyces violaceusniger]|uniref:RpiR family transcriptional regulator n=1 Tax=Streptomyces violaceusniger TaxID=68280 RepID=A0A4D4KW81_STRVO|nr:hypothetical protein SVIO_014430 [Streptomyces violaceusniger]